MTIYDYPYFDSTNWFNNNQKRHFRSESGTRVQLSSAVKPFGRKLKEYKNTQPLIGMPEALPETGVLANHSSGKFERNEWQNKRKNDTHSGFLILDR